MKARCGQSLSRQTDKEPSFPLPLSDDVARETLKERHIGRSFAPTLGSPRGRAKSVKKLDFSKIDEIPYLAPSDEGAKEKGVL